MHRLSLLIVFPAESAAAAATKEIVRLRVLPEIIRLTEANRQQQLQVSGSIAAGDWVDLTSVCRLAIRDDSVASVEGTSLRGRDVAPRKDEWSDRTRGRLGQSTSAVYCGCRRTGKQTADSFRE